AAGLNPRIPPLPKYTNPCVICVIVAGEIVPSLTGIFCHTASNSGSSPLHTHTDLLKNTTTASTNVAIPVISPSSVVGYILEVALKIEGSFGSLKERADIFEGSPAMNILWLFV